uniref:Ig-like domain-containing protein n=1 Tax=Oncorhynchus mykiss TaxID=8022 RepID=A0A8K9WTL9_ONCMY
RILLYVTANICLCSLVHGVAGIESLSIRQESGLKSAKIGDTMILRCFYEGDMAMHFSWYKQNLGDKLQLFSTVHYKYDRNATFYHEFKDNSRFSVQNGPKKNHLRISDMQLSDSGTYYCGNAYTNRVEFGKGVILIVEGTNMPILQQSVSESVQPGDVVTLNCTIHTETCAGEHRVYWFRRGSGESPPGIIYSHGDRSDQCEKSPGAGSPTQSCVYNLPKRNLSLSDAGTYYCAVALCGEILFGNGTKLDIQGNSNFLCHTLSRAIGLVLLCCLTIFIIIYLTRKYIKLRPMTHDSVNDSVCYSPIYTHDAPPLFPLVHIKTCCKPNRPRIGHQEYCNCYMGLGQV